MNYVHYILTILIIIITNGRNHGMPSNYFYDKNNDEGVKHIRQYCDDSMTNENISYTENSICLPWKQFDATNQTWMQIDSSQIQFCNLVNYQKKTNSICNNEIFWSSTWSSISVSFNEPFKNEMLLLFFNQQSKCKMKQICNGCSTATEILKNQSHLWDSFKNTNKTWNNFSINDLNEYETYQIYLIPIINNKTIGNIAKLTLKTKIKAPEQVKVTSKTSNSISIEWEFRNYSSLSEPKFKIKSDIYPHHFYTDLNKLEVTNLDKCTKYCFVISIISNNEEISDKSQMVCETTKHDFNEIEILPIESDSSTFRHIRWNYQNNDCPVSFSVEYGYNDYSNTTITNENSTRLINLESNKYYWIKVKPKSNTEEGSFSKEKYFFTKEIDDLVEDYFKTKDPFHRAVKLISFSSIGKTILRNIPIFDDSQKTNIVKALKENIDKNSNQINIDASYSKNKLSFYITINRIYFMETMDFILKIMNQENHCLVVTNCSTCEYGPHETLKQIMSENRFCQDKIDYIEKAFIVSHIRIKEIGPNNFVSIYSVNNENNEISTNIWLLLLVGVLLLIILVLLADKKGVLSIDELTNRKGFRRLLRGKCMQNNKRNKSSLNDNVVLNSQRNNAPQGVNRRILDPNHPHYILMEEFNKLGQESLIQEKSSFTNTVAVLPGNLKKNRFKNILPYDQTRVVLSNKILNNDYINASNIPFMENPERTEYIAAQGPLPTTITDFWYMVWEQNISLIVMLTKVYEGVQVKCEQYWPATLNTEFAFDENLVISIIMEEEIKNNCFFERKLKVINRETNEERNIIHLQMQNWNDFSKPEHYDFEECLTRFHEITAGNTLTPYLIHCSAGVGRTGTFIAIDRLIKKVVKDNQNLKIYDIVLELRKFRQYMVQQESQYIFIHEFMDYFMLKFKRQSVECQCEKDFMEIPLN